MSDSTIDRVVAEGALAKRFENQINERASLADIPALVEAVEVFDPSVPTPDGDGDSTNEIEIAVDTDGVPYLK